VFSSERLRYWLNFIQLRIAPDQVPRSGAKGAAFRGISLRLYLDGEELLFRRIDGDSLVCLGLDANDHFNVERIIGIYDAWRAAPGLSEYWGLVQFNFDTWESFEREQRFRWMRVKFFAGRARWKLRTRVAAFKKRVAVERYAVLDTVKRLQRDDKVPNSWDVARKLLGEYWTG